MQILHRNPYSHKYTIRFIRLRTYSILHPGPILESKGWAAIFQEKGKEMLKKGKISEYLSKNVQNLKIFEKEQVVVCDNCMQ